MIWNRPPRAKISVLGIYTYDPTIFDGLTVPENMQKQALVTLILKETANLETMYPDPEILKTLITNWSAINSAKWEKLQESTEFEYNPIWNKDGVISETREKSGERANDNSRTESRTSTTSGTTESKTAGLNSTTYQPADETIDSNSVNDGGSVVDSGSESNSESETIERTEQGNIGITSTQQLIKEEREVSMFNLYELIASDFKSNFCVMVY